MFPLPSPFPPPIGMRLICAMAVFFPQKFVQTAFASFTRLPFARMVSASFSSSLQGVCHDKNKGNRKDNKENDVSKCHHGEYHFVVASSMCRVFALLVKLKPIKQFPNALSQCRKNK